MTQQILEVTGKNVVKNHTRWWLTDQTANITILLTPSTSCLASLFSVKVYWVLTMCWACSRSWLKWWTWQSSLPVWNTNILVTMEYLVCAMRSYDSEEKTGGEEGHDMQRKEKATILRWGGIWLDSKRSIRGELWGYLESEVCGDKGFRCPKVWYAEILEGLARETCLARVE